LFSWGAKLGLAVMGAGLGGRSADSAEAAPAGQSTTPTACTVTDSYGVLRAVATSASVGLNPPLTFTHLFYAEVGSGVTTSTISITPGSSTTTTSAAEPVLRMSASASPSRVANAVATFGAAYTGAGVRRSAFSTDGKSISGTVDGQATQAVPLGSDVRNARISAVGRPASAASAQAATPAAQAIGSLLQSVQAQPSTCGVDTRATAPVSSCTRCQLTCREAFFTCSINATQASLAAGILAPGGYLSATSGTCDAALQQCFASCKSSGTCCPDYCQGDAACCSSTWGCCPPSSHSQRTWSRSWPTCPRCGTPPWPAAQKSVTPVTGTCSPRPPITVTTRRGDQGTLQVTITALRSPTAPVNTLAKLEIGAVQNASIEIDGQVRSGGDFTLPLAAGSQSTAFTVRRTTPGQATTVPLTITDDCGAWKTLVGGGPSAF
jgi:hypothetical protein